MEPNKLILRDELAIERTKLANERTFLAYFRTSIFFLATGVSIIHINFFSEVNFLGWLFVVISPLLLSIGVIRLFKVRKSISEMVDKAID
jgi:inner membrane protein YidH